MLQVRFFQALTTGDIPGFIDVVLNFNSPSLTQDNLISKLKAKGDMEFEINFFVNFSLLFVSHKHVFIFKLVSVIQGKRMVFYGDDTWTRLFPRHFVRSDGTTSFFVSDFTEVTLYSNALVLDCKNWLLIAGARFWTTCYGKYCSILG